MRSLGIWNHPKCPSWSPTRLPVPASCLLSFYGLKKLSFPYETNSGRFPSSDYNRSFSKWPLFCFGNCCISRARSNCERNVSVWHECSAHIHFKVQVQKISSFVLLNLLRRYFFFKLPSANLLWIRSWLV